LVAGDRIPLSQAPAAGPERRLPADACDLPARPVRVVLGPQQDLFTEAGIETFLTETFTVSPEADRMGYRLDGPVIEHAGDYNLVSDGIVIGSVQVPGNGRPIVLLADRQSTGGYPKIATVIAADLPLIARCKPGDAVRFEAIDVAAARAATLAFSQRLAALASAVTPAAQSWDQSSERLLGLQLIDGAVSAQP
jgi:allophanate hydrolase subunit 2